MCPRTPLCHRTSVDGQYGDPFNCSRFYLCIDGQSYVSICPAGMSWSERAGHCDLTRRADCDLRLLQRYDSAITNLKPMTNNQEIGTEDENQRTVGFDFGIRVSCSCGTVFLWHQFLVPRKKYCNAHGTRTRNRRRKPVPANWYCKPA